MVSSAQSASTVTLTLTQSDLQSILDHCSREYPNEACGMLAGKVGSVDTVYSLTSECPSPTFYRIDSREQLRVFREMRERGRNLIGIYHSHTGSPAYPSSTDVELAFYPEAVYVIVSLLDREKPSLAAFQIVEGNITEVPVSICR